MNSEPVINRVEFRRNGRLQPVRIALSAVGILTTLLSPAQAASAQVISDTTPPQLTGISFTPSSIDVSSAAQAVVITATITDDLAGVFSVSAEFTGPSGLQSWGTSLSRIAGSSMDGTYRGTLMLPQFVESGVWHLSVSMRDLAVNSVSLSAGNLQGLGFATALTVFSIPDTEDPMVTDITFSPSVLDVSPGAQDLRLSIRVTDNMSGADLTASTTSVTFRSPSGAQRHVIPRPDFALVSGTTLDGTWEVSWSFPQFSEPGRWTLAALLIVDAAGNIKSFSTTQLRNLGLQTDFDIVSSPSDTTPPGVTALTFDPVIFDTSNAARSVSVTVTVQDDLAGVNSPNDILVEFQSQSGVHRRTALQIVFIGGTPRNGTWQGRVFFPRFSEGGTWTVSRVVIKDAVTNSLNLSAAQLTDMHFPTQVTIAEPAGTPDGPPIGPAGGVVIDDDFGDRASLTIPAGILSVSTEVAIDVLSDPNHLGLATPAGFGDGTLFVNIDLNPEPAMPFAPPGLTLVLPFSAFKTPGAIITLFRLDPGTGNLVPAPKVGGGIVTGTVNADGLSATFQGIAHLSTLVGFFPTAVLGDVNGDGVVNCNDMAVVKASFGRRSGQPGYDVRADLNRNGVVDVNDLALVSRQLPPGSSCQ